MVGHFRKKTLLLVFTILVLALAGLGRQKSIAQTSDEKFFPETGHWVTGEFLDAYLSVDNPTMLYGYPLTDAFEDVISHRIVQYFERTRFELVPEESSNPNVRRTPLGRYLYEPGPALPASKNNPGCQGFADIEYQVCYAFLDFFNANGKAAQFGYPISNFEIHDDRIVQYFQLARLEWHPEMPVDQRVRVSNLGLAYFIKMKEDPRLREQSGNRNAIQIIKNIQVRAFPAQAITSNSREQSIFVIVQDQNFKPVVNTRLEISIHLPSGDVLRPPSPIVTDQDGIAVYTFNILDEPSGEAIVNVKAYIKNHDKSATSSFRIWR